MHRIQGNFPPQKTPPEAAHATLPKTMPHLTRSTSSMPSMKPAPTPRGVGLEPHPTHQ